MQASAEDGAFSVDLLVTAVAGNQGVARRVAEMFLSIKPELQARLSHALHSGDLPAAARAAHELCGMAGMMGARQLAQAATAIEENAKSNIVDGLVDVHARLECESDAVAAVLHAVAAPSRSGA